MKKVKITFLLALLIALHSCKKAEKFEIEKPTEKMVNTFVGSGAPGYVDGTGYNTSFNQPLNISTDAVGNIYVADQRNHCIRKISPSGLVTTLAGNGTPGYTDGTGTAARFNNPGGVTVDATGNLYVADSGNNCIRKITQNGVVTTFAGTGESNSGFMDGIGTNARFNNPIATCMDGSGNLIVADLYNNRLRKITTGGVVTTLLGNGSDNFQDGPISTATTPYPTSVVYDPTSGNIYISQNSFISKISPQGIVSILCGSSNLYTGSGYIDGPGLGAKFFSINSIILDKKGNLYASDSDNHIIRKIAPDGYVSTYAGIQYNNTTKFKDGPSDQAYFARPFGLAISKDGDILVSEREGNRIRKITETPIPDSPDEFARKNWNKPTGWK